jgi:hypothetical protein
LRNPGMQYRKMAPIGCVSSLKQFTSIRFQMDQHQLGCEHKHATRQLIQAELLKELKAYPIS